jgi:hypothetical protein
MYTSNSCAYEIFTIVFISSLKWNKLWTEMFIRFRVKMCRKNRGNPEKWENCSLMSIIEEKEEKIFLRRYWNEVQMYAFDEILKNIQCRCCLTSIISQTFNAAPYSSPEATRLGSIKKWDVREWKTHFSLRYF